MRSISLKHYWLIIMIFSTINDSTFADGDRSFNLGTVGDRACFIDPNGKPFFSLGVNHINAIQEHSKEDIFTENFQKNWHSFCLAAREDLSKWHFNTAGYGAPDAIYPLMPFIADCFLERNSNYLSDNEFFYPDVFDPEVQSQKRSQIEWMVKHSKSKNLIGYYWTDTPQWDLDRSLKTRGTNWVKAIQELPTNAPGKVRYEAYLEECKSAEIEPSDEGFLRIIAREHYRFIGEVTRELNPNALILGERYLKDDHPDCVLEEAMPYIDVLSIQPGGRVFEAEYFDALYQKYQKPIIICDHQCSFATDVYPDTMWQQLESESAVANMYRDYVQEAFSKPYIIGYQRCQYIDRFVEHPGVLKQGILQEDGNPYEQLASAIKETNTSILKQFNSSIEN